jgi:hypothetical protein
MPDSLDTLAAADFSLGNCQVIPYNPPVAATAHLFPDDYLSTLYSHMKSALILERTMCGMRDLSHNAITAYLASKPVFAAVEWSPDHSHFHTLGFGFIVNWVGIPYPAPGPRSAFAAYAMFPDSWGTPEAEVLAMLGLARMFHTYSLQSLYGQRYIRNALTARFMSRFGFKDIATLPDFLLHLNGNGVELSASVVSHLTLRDFTDYVALQLQSVESISAAE